MTYRYSFYKIPFSETGIEYPLPEIGNATGSLNSYKTFEMLGTAPFRENQTEIIITEVENLTALDNILKSNYLRVGVEHGNTIDDDIFVNFYWVRDIECLGSLASPPVKVTIAHDDVMTEFFDAPASNNATVAGRLGQCSLDLSKQEGEDVYHYPRSLNRGRGFGYNSTNMTQGGVFDYNFYYQNNESEAQFLLLVSTTDQYGRMRFFVKKGIELSTASQMIENLSRTYKISYITKEEYTYTANCEVTKVYILPASFIDARLLTSQYSAISYFKDTENKDSHTSVLLFRNDNAYQFSWFIDFYVSSDEIFTPNTELFVRTPTNMYKATGDMSHGTPRFKLAFSIPPRGTNSDSFQMLMCGVQEQPIDISDDYSLSFAVNEAAQNRAQFGNLYVLKQVSAAIAGIGGAIGGAVSGNYFGAVQSVVGSVESIADNAAATEGPAQIKSSDNAANWVLSLYPNLFLNATQNCLSYVTQTRVYEAESDTVEYYGYVYDGTPQIEFKAADLQEAFYRYTVCEVKNLAGGGQNAQATVENLFVRGVRFKAL